MYERTRDEGFGPEVKRRIMLGTYVLSAGYYDAYYLKAQQVRTLLRQDYERAFERVDVVATPTTPTPAFQARREDQRSGADVPERHLHGEREPDGAAGDQRAVRFFREPGTGSREPAADRLPADRPRIRRSDAAARRRCVSARHHVPHRGAYCAVMLARPCRNTNF